MPIILILQTPKTCIPPQTPIYKRHLKSRGPAGRIGVLLGKLCEAQDIDFAYANSCLNNRASLEADLAAVKPPPRNPCFQLTHRYLQSSNPTIINPSLPQTATLACTTTAISPIHNWQNGFGTLDKKQSSARGIERSNERKRRNNIERDQDDEREGIENLEYPHGIVAIWV